MSSRSLLLVALVLLGGCGGGDELGDGLLDCERLAFVPQGVLSGRMAGLRSGIEEDLLVDRFEVSRELWQAARRVDPGVADLDGRVGQDWSQAFERRRPAVGMSLPEAERFAAARGMRLPDVGEWLYLAAGSRAQFFPWGNSLVSSAANSADTGLERSADVGTFPAGSSAHGLLDLVGNVWEWTAGEPLPGFAPIGWSGDDPPFSHWAMGGSYLYPARPLFETGSSRRIFALGREPGSQSADVGLRCVIEAEAYLRDRAVDWSAPEVRERVTAVGAAWGPRCVRLLERLVDEPGAAPALTWLLEGARR